MNRRNALINLLVASGTVVSLPFWMQSCGISESDEHTTNFSPKELQLISAVADTIIPAGTTIGALSVGADKYLVKMLDDCYETEVRENVKKQLVAVDEFSNNTYNKKFTNCTPQEREKTLIHFADSGVKEEKEFFDLVKSETIKGFATSREVMADHLGYKVAPGHYYGCVEANM